MPLDKVAVLLFMPEKAINNSPFRPVFIFGCRRSGTTLLRSMLEQHPELLVHPKEPQFILTLLSHFGFTLHHKQKAIIELIQHPYLPENIDREALATFLADSNIQTWPDLIRAYLAYWRKDAEAHRQIVLKDPAFTFHLPSLDQLFPEARYIHVVRHPYGNVSSQRARWQDASVWECAVWWKDAVTIGHRLAQAQPERCLEVEYRALVLNPEESLQQVCQFLEIPFTEKLLDFTLETISFSPEEPPEAKRFTGLDPERLERWRKYLTPMDIRLVEHCCKQEMRWWDYEILKPTVDEQAFRQRLWQERVHYMLLRGARFVKQKVRQLKYRVNL